MITASRLIGQRLGALDGHVGRVRDVLFEDDSLRVRWLVVRLAGGRHVLLAPAALRQRGGGGAALALDLPGAAVRGAPPVETDLPVERRGAPQAPGLFGRAAPGPEPRHCDPRLQSCREVATYAALAGGEPVGRIRDVLLDPSDWTVAALVLGGGRWARGRGSAVAARRIRRIDWEDGTVRLRPAEPSAARDPGGSAGTLQPEAERSVIHT